MQKKCNLIDPKVHVQNLYNSQVLLPDPAMAKRRKQWNFMGGESHFWSLLKKIHDYGDGQ